MIDIVSGLSLALAGGAVYSTAGPAGLGGLALAGAMLVFRGLRTWL